MPQSVERFSRELEQGRAGIIVFRLMMRVRGHHYLALVGEADYLERAIRKTKG
jgi:hypothetical protein